jgi:peptidoglycan/xylan/chitin deacetylase (PgdA/CDA1 family)
MVDVKQTVKRLSAAADRVLPPPAGVTILIYHRVGGGSDSLVDLEPDVFDRQLAHLAEHHRVLTLDEAVAELTAGLSSGWGSGPGSAPGGDATVVDDSRRPVVLTFDDGTDDFCETVVPALVRHGVPATLYAATKFIDEGETFPWGARPTTWSALREALDTGLVTIGSHTHSHWLLDRLDPSVIGEDLDRSIELLGEHLGVMPTHFAYPKALPGSPAAEVAVRRRFRTAALAASRVNQPGATDLHRLWRTPVQRTDDADHFALKAAGGMRLEGELRALAAKLRYRGSTK